MSNNESQVFEQFRVRRRTLGNCESHEKHLSNLKVRQRAWWVTSIWTISSHLKSIRATVSHTKKFWAILSHTQFWEWWVTWIWEILSRIEKLFIQKQNYHFFEYLNYKLFSEWFTINKNTCGFIFSHFPGAAFLRSRCASYAFPNQFLFYISPNTSNFRKFRNFQRFGQKNFKVNYCHT